MLAEAVAETDVEARLVPVATFKRLIAEDAAFRRAVLRNYAERVGDLVVVIQDVLFHALPERLARHLLARARDGAVETTHQAIASELGTAREVVSRVLQRFERDGLIRAERGSWKGPNVASPRSCYLHTDLEVDIKEFLAFLEVRNRARSSGKRRNRWNLRLGIIVLFKLLAANIW